MDGNQNFTNELSQIDTKAIEDKMFVLSPQQQAFIDFKALGGVILNRETDNWEKWSLEKFAQKIGVTRQMLYYWRAQIPNFWTRVAERRKELNSEEWLVRMHETWRLKAAKFDNWPLTEAWLINFDPNYKSPKLKVEHEAGSTIAELLGAARQRNVIEGEVQEAEVVDGTTSDNA